MSTCFSVPVAVDPRSPVFRNTRVDGQVHMTVIIIMYLKKLLTYKSMHFYPTHPPVLNHTTAEPHPTPYDSPVVIPTFKLFVA